MGHHLHADLKKEAHKLIGVQAEKIVEDPFELSMIDNSTFDRLAEVLENVEPEPGFCELLYPESLCELIEANGGFSVARKDKAKSIMNQVGVGDFVNTAFQGADVQSLCTCYCDPGQASIGCTSYFVNDGHRTFDGLPFPDQQALEDVISNSAVKTRYVPVKKDTSDKYAKFGYEETKFTGISQWIFEICFQNFFSFFSFFNLQTTLQGSIEPFKPGGAQVTTITSTAITYTFQ